MDAIRDKQEKIARIHFEQDSRLNETKYVKNQKTQFKVFAIASRGDETQI